MMGVFNGHGVAGAVLQTSRFLKTLSESSFVTIFSINLHSQTVRARELTF